MVSRHSLEGHDARRLVFYLKRQQNYFPRSRLMGRKLLLFRENRNLHNLEDYRVPSLEVIATGHRRVDGQQQGFLMTLALEGYEELSNLLDNADTSVLQQARKDTAELARSLHKHGFVHGSLYPKHIFISQPPGTGPARLIDLEDAWRLPFGNFHRVRDLSKLNRHTPTISNFAKLRFFYRYLQTRKLDDNGRRLLKKIIKNSQPKRERHR
jgi:hypothetical protein